MEFSIYLQLYRTSVIIALLNETLKLNFLTVYTRRNTVLFVMRYWSRGISGALEKREIELDIFIIRIILDQVF